MFTWFDKAHCADLFVDAGEHGSLHKAVGDMAGDVKAVSGHVAMIKPYLPTVETGAVVVGSLENPAFTAWANGRVDCAALAAQWEGFHIVADEQFLIIAGSDRRGAMWGVYHLSKTLLGVDPCYLFTGTSPDSLDSLSVPGGLTQGAPKTFRFRGWFLNDEDLLSDWRDGGGTRHIDYPYYGQVAHPLGIEMALETALRLGMNLIIPASFVDIHNPPEENLIRMAVERGFYVTQHHVEPLGVSHFGFENYWRAQGSEEAFSFVTNREKVIQCWRSAVEKWAKYEGVIWQLGLRGRGDRPAWSNDPAVGTTDAQRGTLISDALAVQYGLVREALGHENFLSTATLWMEGTELFHKGVLRFPKDTVIIFADAGLTQMFGRDFFELARMPEYRYGLYYHVAFWGAGPHLVQGTDLRKMQYQYRLAQEKGDTTYSIVNVTNIREVILCAKANADLVWDVDAFEETAFLDEYFRRHFGIENGAALMHMHFEAFADYPNGNGDGYDTLWKAQASLAQADFKQKVILDGVARGYALECLRSMEQREAHPKDNAAWVEALTEGILAFEQSYASLCAAYRVAQEKGRVFFRDLLLVQEEIILGLYHWAWACGQACIAFEAGDHAAAAGYLRHGVFALEKLLEDRRKAEHGIFENWYRGDTKMNLPGSLAQTRRLLERIEG